MYPRRTALSAALWMVFLLHYLMPSAMAALGSHLLCNYIADLSPRQQAICQNQPETITFLSQGARLGIQECGNQFKDHRWNCTSPENATTFTSHILPVASREAAYTHALTSAGIAYIITNACSRGNLSRCDCDRSKRHGAYSTKGGWRWGGCSADVRYGMTFARLFMDGKEDVKQRRSLMNLHNNRAGRKAVKENMQIECKCHGFSAACSMKTCWQTLSPFNKVGAHLREKFWKAKQVVAIKTGRDDKPLELVRVAGKARKSRRRPRKRDLVYLEKSPNYCDPDGRVGSLGTHGRECNRTSQGMDGCNLLCCGRGYNTHQYVRHWKCNCKFIWCCRVNCEDCSEEVELYTCK